MPRPNRILSAPPRTKKRVAPASGAQSHSKKKQPCGHARSPHAKKEKGSGRNSRWTKLRRWLATTLTTAKQCPSAWLTERSLARRCFRVAPLQSCLCLGHPGFTQCRAQSLLGSQNMLPTFCSKKYSDEPHCHTRQGHVQSTQAEARALHDNSVRDQTLAAPLFRTVLQTLTGPSTSHGLLCIQKKWSAFATARRGSSLLQPPHEEAKRPP